MNGIHLNDYHDQMISVLKKKLPAFESIIEYPDLAATIPTPCAFFGVMDWDIAPDQEHNDQLTVVLNNELIICYGTNDAKHQREIRNLAMYACLKLHEQHLIDETDRTIVISSEPAVFTPELDAYAAWSIKFSHKITVGADVYEGGIIPGIIKIGIAPDIGPGNEDKYIG